VAFSPRLAANVGSRVHFTSSLAAPLLEGYFVNPAWPVSAVLHLNIHGSFSGQQELFRSLLGSPAEVEKTYHCGFSDCLDVATQVWFLGYA
jgi:hypothetical protein